MKKFTIFTLIMLTVNFLSAQWIQQNLNYPTEGALSDIFFIDHNFGWTVGESDQTGCQGHYTIDGGNEWNPITQNYTYEKANSVFFSDQNNGWIVCNDGIIIHTNDGGGNTFSWELQESGTDYYDLVDVFFVDSLTGWIIGSRANPFNSIILKTTNGGISWLENYFNSFGGLGKIFFLDSLNGWAIGGGEYVLYTTDGGDTWFGQYTGVEGNGTTICFVDANNGWFLSTVYSYNTYSYVYYTNDMGNTWEEILNVPYHLYDMQFTDPLNGWLIGDNGTILQTSDGGETWESQESGTSNWLKSICFTDQNFGWICDGTEGSNPVILHTTNGGIVGINENPKSKDNMIIYPNPTNDIATVSFDLAQNEKITLSITNTKGQLVKQISLKVKENDQFDIDCSKFSPGIYFINLQTKKGILSEKLIIE